MEQTKLFSSSAPLRMVAASHEGFFKNTCLLNNSRHVTRHCNGLRELSHQTCMARLKRALVHLFGLVQCVWADVAAVSQRVGL